jgi:hypothetical protein
MTVRKGKFLLLIASSRIYVNIQYRISGSHMKMRRSCGETGEEAEKNKTREKQNNGVFTSILHLLIDG